MKRPPALKKGDRIGIAAPARKITFGEIEKALTIFEDHGYHVIYDEELFAVQDQYAGDDDLRAAYFQQMLDDDRVKAIFPARGGYGSVRIIDKLDFARFCRNPKWIIGYSDITVFHSHINRNFGIQTLHATMPVNFAGNKPQAIEGMFDVLEGGFPDYSIDSHPLNRQGSARGVLAGGNLSVLYSLLGSRSFPETKGKILFLEDLEEYLYHIDRMMVALKRANILKDLAGLIIGGMTKMNDNEISFGKTAEEIIREAVDEYSYPVCFGFPAGHIVDNRPLIMGAETEMEVGKKVKVGFVE
ncbi:MAG: LD-carboxypeptidase [Chlorobi bacterium]|nr:LD-carboxypeptidase [Chlorobiota bacterium]